MVLREADYTSTRLFNYTRALNVAATNNCGNASSPLLVSKDCKVYTMLKEIDKKVFPKHFGNLTRSYHCCHLDHFPQLGTFLGQEDFSAAAINSAGMLETKSVLLMGWFAE